MRNAPSTGSRLKCAEFPFRILFEIIFLYFIFNEIKRLCKALAASSVSQKLSGPDREYYGN